MLRKFASGVEALPQRIPWKAVLPCPLLFPYIRIICVCYFGAGCARVMIRVIFRRLWLGCLSLDIIHDPTIETHLLLSFQHRQCLVIYVIISANDVTRARDDDKTRNLFETRFASRLWWKTSVVSIESVNNVHNWSKSWFFSICNIINTNTLCIILIIRLWFQ